VRSGGKRHIRAGTFAWLAAVLMCIFAPQVMAQSEGSAPTEEEILDALQRVRSDPNLSGERTVRTLRWKKDDEPKQRDQSGFLRWLREFFGWLGQLSRALVWLVGALLALAVIGFIVRILGKIGPVSAPTRADRPTHVRDLDIRPESLPNDIGAAAWTLWQNGEHRGALALLYRGLLSKLVHIHHVPIRDSTTEGDCLALAAKHLEPSPRDYVSTLIRTWQRAIYGGHELREEEVRALCDGFDAALRPNAEAGASA
jgi:hypothetical protein